MFCEMVLALKLFSPPNWNIKPIWFAAKLQVVKINLLNVLDT